jgi:antitoxin YefM
MHPDALDRILYIRDDAAMKTVSYTDARNRLARLMAEASDSREPVAITRNGAAAVVLVDAEEWASLQETLHLLASPANARRLQVGLAEFAKAKRSSPRQRR